MKNVTILLAVAVAVMAVGTAQAEPILYDGFDYAGGVLDGVPGTPNDGGTGFATDSQWTKSVYNPIELTTDSTSLSYPVGTPLAFSGNRIQESVGGGWAQRDTNFTIDLAADGEVWYASMLLKPNGSSHKLLYMSGYWYFGQNDSGKLWGGIAGNNPDIGPALEAGATYFIVSKIVTDTGTGDEGYIKAYKVGTDTVSDEPAVGSWDWEVYSSNGFPDEQLTQAQIYLANAGDEMDEIRIGRTWNDVTVPEPATMALLGIGGIGVLIRRKRR